MSMTENTWISTQYTNCLVVVVVFRIFLVSNSNIKFRPFFNFEIDIILNSVDSSLIHVFYFIPVSLFLWVSMNSYCLEYKIFLVFILESWTPFTHWTWRPCSFPCYLYSVNYSSSFELTTDHKSPLLKRPSSF